MQMRDEVAVVTAGEVVKLHKLPGAAGAAVLDRVRPCCALAGEQRRSALSLLPAAGVPAGGDD
jgi:hypothetical protein